MYKVSVIVPVYGAEKYIEKCAQSLFGQTLDGIEYIFINDCTPDNSEDILKKTLDFYPNRKNDTKIIKMSSNKGQAIVRRYGIQLAQGEYVIFCDSDDWIDKDAYELMYNKAIETNADIVVSDFVYEYSNYSVVKKQEFDNGRDGALKALLNCTLHCSTCNKLIRRKIYTEHDLLSFDGVNMWEDVLLIIPACAYSSNVVYLPKPLYHYVHYNTDSITTRASKKSLENIRFVIEIIESFLKSIGEFEKFENDLLNLKLSGKLIFLLYSQGEEQKEYSILYPETNKIITSTKAISPYWKLAMYLSYKLNISFFNCFARFSYMIKIVNSFLKKIF